MKPTVLYLLEHNTTRKRYLGKTIYPEKLGTRYFGSGLRWKKHLKKHSKDISVLSVSETFTDKDELEEFALLLSEDLDIVESEYYLNLKEETGLDGGVIRHSPETRKKIGESIDYKKQGATLSETMTDPHWRKTVGDQAVAKRLASQDFIATGKAVSRTKQDPEWKRTVGVESRAKQVANTDYKATTRKSADTRLSGSWKENNTYSCEVCGSDILGAGNFKQHKGSSKCLQKAERGDSK